MAPASLAIGAWIRGTGGGGSPQQGRLDRRQLYRDGAAAHVIVEARA